MDFVSMISTSLRAGAVLSSSGVFEQTVDGQGDIVYKALCERLAIIHNIHIDSAKIMSPEDSDQQELREKISESSIADDSETVALLAQLHELLQATPPQTARSYAIDVDLIEAGKNVLIERVDSLRAQVLRAGDNLTLQHTNALGLLKIASISLGQVTARTVNIVVHNYFADEQPSLSAISPENLDGESVQPGLQICPYRGLDTFRMDDAHLFNGRDNEITELIDTLDSHPLAGVIAASGSGKSSLVYAGLLPTLSRQDSDTFWDVFAFKPGREPLKSLSRTMASVLGPYGDLDEEAEQINRRVRNLRSGNVTLRDLVERAREIRRLQNNTAKHRVLFFVDQWEELYTQLDNPSDRSTLLRELLDVANRGEAQLLLTLRADFMGEMLSQDRAFFEQLKPGICYLTPMSEENIRAVIEKPAATVGLNIPDGLASQLIEDAQDEPGYLPYLQFVLKRLWEKRDQTTHLLTAKAYEDLGGLKGAIGKHAQGVYQTQLTEAEQALARTVLPRLIHVSGLGSDVSIRQPLSSFGSAGQALLRKLAEQDSRLVVLHGKTDSTSAEPLSLTANSVVVVEVEVAHEALIRDWPELNHWVTERESFYILRGKFDADAARWESEKREPDYLIPMGKPLLDAQALLRASGADDISDTLKTYIDASVAAEKAQSDQELQRATRFRLMAWGAVATAIVAVVFGANFLIQRNSAEAARDEAITAQRTAIRNESVALIGLARSEVNSPINRAKLALAAWPRNSADTRPTFRENWKLLNGLLPRLLERGRLSGHEDSLNGALYDKDNTRILTWSRDNTARLWDASNGDPIATLKGHTESLAGALYNEDNTRILTWSDDNTARLWDAGSGEPITTLKGHTEPLVGALYNEDNTRILTWSKDNTARLWDASSGEPIATLKGHTESLNGALYNEDNTRILTWSKDTNVRLWDARSGEHITTLEDHEGEIRGALYSPDNTRILTWSKDATALLWDAGTGTLIISLEGHTESLHGALYSPEGTRILTWSDDNTARLWNANSGEPIATLEENIVDALYSSDGTRILSWSWETTARVWDASTGTLITTLEGHTGSLRGALYNPEGTRILTWSEDATTRLWDAGSGEPIITLEGHDDTIYGALISADQTRILTWSEDTTARLWDASVVTPIATLEGHTRPVEGALYSADNTRILTWSYENTPRLWDASTGTLIATLDGHTSFVVGALYSEDNTRILTWSWDNSARLWDASSGESIATLEGHTFFVVGALYSVDNTHILTWSSDTTARLWDASTGTLIFTLEGHDDTIKEALYSADHTRILTLSWDNSARLWDASTGIPIITLEGHTKSVEGALFSTDSTRILTWSDDKTARIWSAISGELFHSLEGHTRFVEGALFSTDSTRILTWSYENTPRLWDARSGELITTLEGHTSFVVGALYSSDNTRILTWSGDTTARLWDASSGKLIATLEGHEQTIKNAVYSSDNTLILTVSDDNTVRLWDASTGLAISILRGLSGIVKGASFSPDNTSILTWSDENTTQLWDMQSQFSGNFFVTICSLLPDHELANLGSDFSLNFTEKICQLPETIPSYNSELSN